MTKGYQKENTCVHLLNYHFVWCPKYRRKILHGELREQLIRQIHKKAHDINSKVLTLEVMPDHVHMFITGNPTLAPNEIVGSIKGYTSKVLREQYPELKKMPTLWTRSYFVSTAGKVSQFVIQKYIEEQYKK